MVDENVTDEPKKTVDSELELGWDFDDDGGEEQASARATVAPPFDVASFAKEAMAVPDPRGSSPEVAARRPSLAPKAPDAVIPNRVISLPPPPPLPSRTPGARPSLPPLPPIAPSHPFPTDEFIGRSAPRGPSTKPPPPAHPPPEAFSAVITPVPPSEPPSQRITPREMKKLEAALTLSRQDQARSEKAPPPARGNTLLQMANTNAPLLTPPRVAAVAQPPTTPPPPDAEAQAVDPIVEMQERFALGDYSGALVMAESMLEENPTHVEAREYADSCRAVLQQMYTARIGPLDRVPVIDVARDQLRWLSIDHRTGFILSLVDGVSSLEMILDVCGMPALDALRMLFELVQQRIISIRDD
jgi:hypothetical protein